MTSRPLAVRSYLEATDPLARWLRAARDQQQLLHEIRARLPADLAGQCIAAARNGDRLVLFAPSPVWANRLRFAAPAALSALPGARSLRVRVMPPPATDTVPKTTCARPLSRETAELIRYASDAVTDPLLKQALRRLAAHGGGDPGD